MKSTSLPRFALLAFSTLMSACGTAGITGLDAGTAGGALAAGSGSAGDPGVATGTAIGSASAGAQTGGNVAAPTITAAAGMAAGFELAAQSTSATAHPASDVAFWTANAKALQALVSGSVPTARLVVGSYDASAGEVNLAFPRPTSTTLKASSALSYASRDAFDALLGECDRVGLQAVLEVAVGYNAPDDLLDAVLAAYGSHKSVVAISFDASTDKNDQLTADEVKALLGDLASKRAGLGLQLRATSASTLPGGIAGVTYVLDTKGSSTTAGVTQAVQAFAASLPGQQLSVIVGSSNQRAAVCALAAGPSALLSAATAGSANVRGIYWSSDTAATLSPGTGFACTAASNTAGAATGATAGAGGNATDPNASSSATNTASGSTAASTTGAGTQTGSAPATGAATGTGTAAGTGTSGGTGTAAGTGAGTAANNGSGISTAAGSGESSGTATGSSADNSGSATNSGSAVGATGNQAGATGSTAAGNGTNSAASSGAANAAISGATASDANK